MADALDLLENWENLNVGSIVHETIQENAEAMADLNALQLSQGKRATGTDIKPAYHPLTIELKKGQSGLSGITDRVTLYDTGSHYRNLYAQVKGDEIEYGSRDHKSESLQKKYGAIYGLTEESRDELVNQHLEGSFNSKIHEALGYE